MALFDGLVREVEQRFELGGKADHLLAALLKLMTAENGLSGFLNRFRAVGLGELVSSWVSSGANAPLANQQAEDALGTDLIGQFAAQTGLPVGATLSSLAFMIPAIVDNLTPDGVVPSSRSLAATLGSYLGAPIQMPERTIAAAAGGNGILRVLLPLLLVGLFAFLGYQFCARPNQEIARATSLNQNRQVESNTTVATNQNSNTLAIVTNSAADSPVIASTGEEAIRAANERAKAALSNLTVNGTPQQVVEALNLSIINFATNSAEIPADNLAILRQAADVLKQAPAATRIEVGGHTDSDGDDASNQQLSNRRAAAVRNQLVNFGVNSAFLTAKGYGEIKPRATNDTAEGRFQNRRIEYTLTPAIGAAATTIANTNAATNANSNHGSANHGGAH